MAHEGLLNDADAGKTKGRNMLRPYEKLILLMKTGG